MNYTTVEVVGLRQAARAWETGPKGSNSKCDFVTGLSRSFSVKQRASFAVSSFWPTASTVLVPRFLGSEVGSSIASSALSASSMNNGQYYHGQPSGHGHPSHPPLQQPQQQQVATNQNVLVDERTYAQNRAYLERLRQIIAGAEAQNEVGFRRQLEVNEKKQMLQHVVVMGAEAKYASNPDTNTYQMSTSHVPAGDDWMP